MNDLTVLHLSDLHVDDTGLRKNLLLKNLLKDIESEMRYSDNIIIVVTGDLVNRANYLNQQEIVDFFDQLKKILGDKVKQIYIVPGNHDKIRSDMDQIILENVSCTGEKIDDARKWRYIRVAFEEYRNLVRKIYALYYPPGQVDARVCEDTYGVHIDTINGKNVCVIQFNTAWASKGDKDQRQLSIGQYQLQQIRKQYAEKYSELSEERIDLTIALAHHPLNWLLGQEEDLIQEEILSSTGLNVNTYICGHTHNRDVINWHNNRRSMITLVSGLGWPDGSTQHPYAHTYSSYVFNLDVNSVDVYVRSSDDAYKFQDDFRIYTNQSDKVNKKIVMPIDTCKTQAYFNLGAARTRSSKGCYITAETITEIKNFAEVYLECEDKLRDRLESIKSDLQSIVDTDNDTGRKLRIERLWRSIETPHEPIDWNETQTSRIMDEFSNYLTAICLILHKAIQKIKEQALFRTHFRYWGMAAEDKEKRKEEDDQYLQLSLYGAGLKDHPIRPLKWGELIEESYLKRMPLIASVNAKYCAESMQSNNEKTEPDKKWMDFITVIPEFEKNNYVEKNTIDEEVHFARPLLTFGLTVYEEKDRDILYMLDYLRIDKFIGRQINKFLHYFPINIEDFIKTLKNKEGQNVGTCNVD